jgi:hypothetical protein
VRTELFIEGRKADVNADIPSLLTFAIDDVKNFATRSTAFSKTIVLPGSARNNALFGHIFETGHANEYDNMQRNVGYNFNPAVAAKCLVFLDNLQCFKGTIRMLEIIKDKKGLEYEMALNGELTGLSVQLSSGFLTDLDFHEYDTTYTAANIAASWDNTPGSGCFFPLIDYGTYSVDKKNWDIRTFRPALYVKEYIDKIFEAADFRYDCSLFSTERFKRLVIPHNQKTLQALTGTLMTADRQTLLSNIITSMGITEERMTWQNFDSELFTESTEANPQIFTYNGSNPINTTITFEIQGTRTNDIATLTGQVKKNGVALDGVTLTLNPIGMIMTVGFAWVESFDISLNAGDTLEWVFSTNNSGGSSTYNLSVSAASLSIGTSAGTVPVPVGVGDQVQMHYAIPQNIRQIDFLLGIIKLFNLYMYESQFDDRLINIAPYIDFYDGTVVDWTGKINRDVPIRIKPMSELNSKIYNFNLKDDSDYYNDLYKKRYNQTYGAHTFDSQFEFASQTNKLEIIFAPTPLVGYVDERKVYSTIFKRTGEGEEAREEKMDSVIRILQTKKIDSVPSWSIMDGEDALGSFTSYGYAGHFDDPDNPDNDLNFGVCKEYFYTLRSGDLSKTQFNIYWSPYMAEITSKDSKLLIAKFFLKPKDIFSLDFRKYVFVDGSLYRLNKIVDYNASNPTDCTVELLKVINTAYSFPVGEPAEENVWIDYDDAYVTDDDDSKILYDETI